ncbi:MFS transporter [Neisseria sp. Ec49-e6-T10]|uniref:MFS transporter n=1 Tax=Neisseria sp. Ec49-e6-T10 TaxID=3140744 RepID=UPI003EB9EE07
MGEIIQKQPVVSKNKLLFIAGLGWLFDAMDVGLLSFILAALKQDWGLSATELGWIGGVNSIGMAVGAFVFGVWADKRGRKSAFMFTLLLFSLASGLTAFAQGLVIFMILRFFIGMGLGGELPVASTLVSESVPANERGRIVVLLESFWAFGWLAAALIAYFVIPQWGWRAAMLLCALPALYTIYLRRNLPESDHFERIESADKKLSVMCKIQALWAPEYRRSTIMLWIVWFTVVFSYYGMFLWLPSVVMMKGFSLIKSFEYVLVMTLAQLPGYFTAAWLIEKVGRRFVLVTYLSGTVVSAFFFGEATSSMQLIAFGMLLSFFNLGAWGALYAYTPEQYPTAIRATGAGLAASVGRIGGILGPLMVGYFVAANLSISLIFIVFCLTIVLGILAIIFLGRETKMLDLT